MGTATFVLNTGILGLTDIYIEFYDSGDNLISTDTTSWTHNGGGQYEVTVTVPDSATYAVLLSTSAGQLNIVVIYGDDYYNIIGNVSMTISGSAETNQGFSTDQDIIWDIDALVDETIEYEWETTPVLYYYRIEGECVNEARCDNTGFLNDDLYCISNGQKFILVVAATDLADLCLKLKDEKSLNPPWNWPIKSIKKFSRPVYRSDAAIQVANGVDHDCNFLEEVPFYEIPECLDFNVKYVVYEDMAIEESTSDYEFVVPLDLQYSSLIDLKISGSGSVYYDGFIDTFDPNKPKSRDIILENGLLDWGMNNVNVCGCNGLSLYYDFEQNISFGNELSEFLNKNGFVIPSILPIRFSGLSNSWKSNHRFVKGSEVWNVLFDWGCANQVGGYYLDTPFWKLTVHIKKQKGSLDKETKILFTFGNNAPCKNGSIDFNIKINHKTKSVATNFQSNIENNIIFDEIGLFKTKYWSNKLINFSIKDSTEIVSLTYQDISSIIN